ANDRKHCCVWVCFFFLDTDRALVLLEEYCKKLRKPEEQQLKKAIRKVMGIFKSSLFQALLGRY
uniref:L27-1 domain-containing protein n=1 Tax=Cyanoderma ruficeps TaxID=181631 RepID=A0A8C3R8A9_9PASS